MDRLRECASVGGAASPRNRSGTLPQALGFSQIMIKAERPVSEMNRSCPSVVSTAWRPLTGSGAMPRMAVSLLPRIVPKVAAGSAQVTVQPPPRCLPVPGFPARS